MNTAASNRVRFIWSTKGGSGTSTVAATTAIRLSSEEEQSVLLVDLEGDQPALIGMVHNPPNEVGLGDWLRLGDERDFAQLEGLCEDVGPGMRLLRQGNLADDADPSQIAEALAHLSQSSHVVVDGGLDNHGVRGEVDGHSGYAVAVMKPCYLTLSRAQHRPGPYDRVIYMDEPGRALRARDVAAAVGASHVEKFPWDVRIARAIDAGTIVGMLPPSARRFNMNFGGMDESLDFDASALRSDASEMQAGSRECGNETTSGGRCTQRVAPGATECRSGHPIRP